MELEPNAFSGTLVVAGRGAGRLLVLAEPLSFWGGLDSQTGNITEPGHPQYGSSIAGKVMLMAQAKGSSSSSSVLAEAIRNGTGPAAIVMRGPDLIVGLGCIVASELYARHVPIVAVTESVWRVLVSQHGASTGTVEADAQRCLIVIDRDIAAVEPASIDLGA